MRATTSRVHAASHGATMHPQSRQSHPQSEQMLPADGQVARACTRECVLAPGTGYDWKATKAQLRESPSRQPRSSPRHVHVPMGTPSLGRAWHAGLPRREGDHGLVVACTPAVPGVQWSPMHRRPQPDGNLVMSALFSHSFQLVVDPQGGEGGQQFHIRKAAVPDGTHESSPVT